MHIAPGPHCSLQPTLPAFLALLGPRFARVNAIFEGYEAFVPRAQEGHNSIGLEQV